jgi:hypothetical protein
MIVTAVVEIANEQVHATRCPWVLPNILK